MFYKGRQSDKTERLTEYIPMLIERKRKARDIATRTLDNWNSLNNFIIEYEKENRTTIYFDSVNLIFYDKFVTHLRDRGQADGTIGKNIKILKTILGYATREKYNYNKEYDHFKVMAPKSDAVYLNIRQIMKFYHLDLEDNSRLDRVRDLFVLSCFTGMRFSDTIALTSENIKMDQDGEEFVEYIAEKSDTKATIYLNPVVKAILEKYNYNLPEISNQKANQYLKELGQHAGLDSDYKISRVVARNREYEVVPFWSMIKTHTCRRSFITNLYLDGVPLNDIMAMSGHSDLRVLQNYIKASTQLRAQRSKEKASYLNVISHTLPDKIL
ncbi:Tyrosine recombinase XerC [subsurface metagenome]